MSCRERRLPTSTFNSFPRATSSGLDDLARFREGEPPGEPSVLDSGRANLLVSQARFREGEPLGEPSVLSARREPRPPGITHDDLGETRTQSVQDGIPTRSVGTRFIRRVGRVFEAHYH